MILYTFVIKQTGDKTTDRQFVSQNRVIVQEKKSEQKNSGACLEVGAGELVVGAHHAAGADE